MSLYIFVSTLYLSLPNLTLNILPANPPVHLSLSLTHTLSPPPSPYLTPPSLFPDKKFPVEAHFWLDKLFYYIEDTIFQLKRRLKEELNFSHSNVFDIWSPLFMITENVIIWLM